MYTVHLLVLYLINSDLDRSALPVLHRNNIFGCYFFFIQVAKNGRKDNSQKEDESVCR